MSGHAEPGTAAAVPGPVELREDMPLKAALGALAGAAGAGAGAGAAAGASATCCAGGPRLIIACFAALTAAISLALFTQIYYGDFEVVPHGGVASDAAACSEAGTRALKDGGRAVDAGVVAALCLAVLAPHRTSLDASGSLVYWEYRQARTQMPTLMDWGAADPSPAGPALDPSPAGPTLEPTSPPRLLAALASFHAQYGVLSWGRVLKPAISFARNGFPVSPSLAAALALAPASRSVQPRLAAYLESLQHNSSAQLSAAWSGAAGAPVSRSAAGVAVGGAWRLVAGGVAAGGVRRALRAALQPPPAGAPDAEARVVEALQREAAAGAWPAGPAGVATGLAVVDPFDTYVAMVTGLSTPFGSGPATTAGWRRDEPAARLDLAPAILLEERVCGTRFVVGGASGGALAQAAAALAAGAGAAGVERARVGVAPGGLLAPDPAPVNVVQQHADTLLTHADSRGGGLASRF